MFNSQTITYDEIGNPLSYRDGMTMTWKNGRQLSTLQSGENSVSYSYNSDGVRVSKTVDGEKCTYEYINGMLLYETRGEKYFHYYYDSNGTLYAVNYKLGPNDTSVRAYYFTHNWRGDIVGIYNGNGELRARYEYDSWGNVLSITDQNGSAITDENHIANLNPFRYRSYYMDTETGMYYLMSRYYDPVTHRFLNADSQLNLNSGMTGVNLFGYCGNNPINRNDPTGHAWWHWAIGAAVVAACAVATVVTCGGFAAAATAVCMVSSGFAAATTASTIAAGAFIGSATVYGMSVVSAASTSRSTSEFCSKGNWGTVAATAGGAVLGGAGAYIGTRGSSSGSSASSRMNKVAEKGRIGEAASGIVKNTQRIRSYTETAKYRIPDGLDHTTKILSEVKNYSGTLSYTSQLKDFVLWSQANGYQMHLYTNATLSGPLQQAVCDGVIHVFPLNV